MHRLVLGCGSIGHAIVTEIRGGAEDLIVVDADEGRVETLREEGVTAELADPSDPNVIRAHGEDADTILVAADDPSANRDAATAAADLLPAAYVVVYTGVDPDAATCRAIREVADAVVDDASATGGSVLDAVGSDAGERLCRLAGVLRGIDGRLGVFMHDNPDPDAIGSAIALRQLAERRGIDADAYYFGDITHQENRALVNLLDLRLRHLEPDEFDPTAFAAIALVDHSRPGVNDHLPEDTAVDIVIDHHPPREPVEARFVDLRSDVGATSTLLADYLRRFGVEMSTTVATALLYGIRVDTRDFGREITRADFEATAYLLPHADVDVLERVESPSISPATFDTIARAIRDRRQEGSIVVSSVGQIRSRDELAQAADQLLAMEGVTTTVVYGFREGTVNLSARTRGTDLDIGETVRRAFGRIGSAGGHADMAGAQIPLGILGEVDDEGETLDHVVTDLIRNRFFEVVGLRRVLEPNDVEVPEDVDASPR